MPRQTTQPAGVLPPWLGAALIAVAAAAAYATSFRGVFVFDDIQSIVENPTIRKLWPLTEALAPPSGGLTVSGRPVLNLSFALNHAISGTGPWSYHAVNLLIHTLAAWVLFALVRRALQSPFVADRWRAEAPPIALAAALLWAVHPLQTQAVTYVVQRAESLMGLFYFLTVYAFLRGATTEQRPVRWFALAVASCLLGMGTKEVMATAPLMVWLFDRTFLAGSFAEAWRRRRAVHLALAATWLPLAWAIAGNDAGMRGGTAGFGSAPWGDYLLTQFEAVTRYVGLAFWPHPLVLDYGTGGGRSFAAMLPWMPVVVGIVGATLWLVWRRPVAGFLGAWFLGILAVTSLVPGRNQVIVEPRMYLPLAAVLMAVVLILRSQVGRAAWWVVGGLAVAGVVATAQRNLDYHSVLAIWADTVAKRPTNANARNNHANALADAGRLEEAVTEYEAVLATEPGMHDVRYNLGLALTALHRPREAALQLAEATRLKPDYAPAAAAFGDVLSDLGRFNEAVVHYEWALQLNSADADAHNNLGVALLQLNRVEEARQHFADALRLRPDLATARQNLEALGR